MNLLSDDSINGMVNVFIIGLMLDPNPMKSSVDGMIELFSEKVYGGGVCCFDRCYEPTLRIFAGVYKQKFGERSNILEKYWRVTADRIIAG